MLSELELELVALVKASSLAAKVKTVESLPELDGEDLVKRFGAEAPAVYIAPASFSISGGNGKPRFGVAGVARNARGQKEARHGDAKLIGLYGILDALLILLEGASTAGSGWTVTGVRFSNEEIFYRNGLYVGAIDIEGAARIDQAANAATLDAFLRAYVNYDMVEPGGPGIDASDQVNVPQ